jgi:sugar phosphate isomerase/epimerase
MFSVSLSQLTTMRWGLAEELSHLAAHGFDGLSIWRAKLSDDGAVAVAAMLSAAGVRVSSLQWAGGFTGADGRSFTESVDDAVEAVEAARVIGAPVLVVHSGCRGGHTRAHARRLFVQALATLAPLAREAGVTLALKAMRPEAGGHASFLARPIDALGIVEDVGEPSVRLALDLWQWADDAQFALTLPRLAASTSLVQVADRVGPVTADWERLPVCRGTLPLEALITTLVEHGYGGDFVFDPVGEAVTGIGYAGVVAETRRHVDAWSERLEQRLAWRHAAAAVWQASGAAANAGHGPVGGAFRMPLRAGQFRSAGSRRSHASSHVVSRG